MDDGAVERGLRFAAVLFGVGLLVAGAGTAVGGELEDAKEAMIGRGAGGGATEGSPVGASDCCSASFTPGCDNGVCQDAVCTVDPFCCDNSWDTICADEAFALCTDICTCNGTTNGLLYPRDNSFVRVDFFGDGCTGSGCAQGTDQHNDDDSASVGLMPTSDLSDCCFFHELPGCDDGGCEAMVCDVDPFCCDTLWDSICADEAANLCGTLCSDLGFAFDLYGDIYTSCFVNNNGNITFGVNFSSFAPVGFPDASIPAMVAPFWGDVDTGNPDHYVGDVWMKYVDSNGDGSTDTLVVTWDNVGYYNENGDMRDTFQVALSDGLNPVMGLGHNVCFSFDNMCWTTGDAAGGVGGFGGTPATVGVNRGNGEDFIQVGRFDHAGTDYDGPGGANDGVSYLDGQVVCFNTSTTTTNIPPIAASFPPGNQVTVDACLGETLQLGLEFLSPEAGQTTTVEVSDPDGAQDAGLSVVVTPGNVATVALNWTPDPADVGSYVLGLSASDNFNPPGVAYAELRIDIIASGDATAPVAAINEPPELGAGCACDSAAMNIVGTADDPDGTFDGYALEFRRTNDPNWTLIATGTSPVVNGVLGQWNTNALAEGYYLLRLTAMNRCLLSETFVRVVYLDKQFGNVDVRYPHANQIVARNVCVDGTMFDSWCFDSYTVDVRPTSGGAFTPVDPGTPVYTSTVVNDPFAHWDTQGLGVPDGDYTIRAEGTTDCGNVTTALRDVTVDNTPPVAVIDGPADCDFVGGQVQIIGTALDANLDNWVLQYTGDGVSGWVTIATGNTSVTNGVLGTWDTDALPNCAYALRLVVTDLAVFDCGSPIRQRSEHIVTVNTGSCGSFDADNDGDVDLLDFGAFQDEFTGPLP